MNQPQLDFWKDVGIIALTTFFSGTFEYIRQGHQHRASNFVQMRRRFLEDPLFRDLLNLMATDSAELKDTPIQIRRNFVGFLEEVALMVNSGLIKKEVAHYMFGYYVLLTDRCENFWDGLDRDSQYWAVFRQLAMQMKGLNEGPSAAPSQLKF